MTSALILFAHGARDPKWAEPFRRLRALVQAQISDARVELAFLELMTPRLPDLVDQLVADGCDVISVVPVFLGQGGHVQRDLPVLAEQLRLKHPRLMLQVASAVGEDESVLAAMAAYCMRVAGSPV